MLSSEYKFRFGLGTLLGLVGRPICGSVEDRKV